MANQFNTRQWYIDTAFSSPAQLAQSGGPVKVQQIEFMAYTGATDQCVVQDRNGNIVWNGTGDVGKEPIRSGKIGWVNGITVPTLSSGKCLIYIE